MSDEIDPADGTFVGSPFGRLINSWNRLEKEYKVYISDESNRADDFWGNSDLYMTYKKRSTDSINY